MISDIYINISVLAMAFYAVAMWFWLIAYWPSLLDILVPRHTSGLYSSVSLWDFSSILLSARSELEVTLLRKLIAPPLFIEPDLIYHSCL